MDNHCHSTALLLNLTAQENKQMHVTKRAITVNSVTLQCIPSLDKAKKLAGAQRDLR